MALFGDDQGKTEKPTPSRLSEVRNRGDTPLSRELVQGGVLLVAAVLLTWCGSWLLDAFGSVLRAGLTVDTASSRTGDVPFEPGMILSNEPGYYREGAFGIRIENLILVEEAPPLPGGDTHRQMLRFRNLTWAPIDRRLIDAAALTPAERGWLDAYHAEVSARIGPRVSDAARAWLAAATAPV